MLQITDLPEEILVIIVRKLDFWSLCSMFNTCKCFRNLLSLHGVIVECNMSMNLVATVNTLKLGLFKSIANHLLELNMRGVSDLTRAKILPVFKKLKRLKVLDISYTNLIIADLMAIHSVCPSLKDVTVNFVFGQTAAVLLVEECLLQYQSLFSYFENIHLVGSLQNLLYSKLVFRFLKRAKLDTLKFSAVEVDNIHTTVLKPYNIIYEVPQFNHFAIFLMNWRATRTYEHLSKFPVISTLNLENYDYFIIHTSHGHAVSVYATSLFKKFFKEHFDIDSEQLLGSSNLVGNVALFIWNRTTTKFDDIFFQKLYIRIKPYFCFIYRADSAITCPHKYDWIYAEPQVPNEMINLNTEDNIEFGAKRRKTAMPSLVLDYDNVLKDKLDAQLSLVFKSSLVTAVSLQRNCNYLPKLSFLSLAGRNVNYHLDFFNTLFNCCHNLTTLSVECPVISSQGYCHTISRAVQASRSIKHLRVVDKEPDFKIVFENLSQCKTLESIYLVDLKSWDHSKIADPTLLIKGCSNLCSVFIEAPFAETAQTQQLQWFNKAKTTYRKPYVRVVINGMSSIKNRFKYDYDPYIDVFQLHPIKPI
uniref:F-box domain-containing protein n=1 Tax=Heliothis virescens TaxID=7102 RepID=A0A2A4JXL4_HELVI